MIYDLSISAEQARALGHWVTPGRSMAAVELCADDRMLVAEQGDDRMAWDTDGSPGSDEYLAVAPLDPSPLQGLVKAIHAELDGTEWSADTPANIAELLIAAGFTIRHPDED